MNCKPNQLCRIIKGPNVNAIVRTVARCTCLKAKIIRLKGDALWTIEALQHLEGSEWNTSKKLNPGSYVCMEDSHMKPLGEEGPEDKTITDTLREFINEEVKKIPIMPVESL